jgi:DNA-binding response OmpR family regulator
VLGAAAGRIDAEQGLAALRRSGFCVQIARERKAPRPRAEAANVVLVEDDAMLAHFTRTFLALAGHAVRVASHRAEIVEQIRRPPRPDLFLLDVELPDADGFDILRRIREHPVLHDVPVIMLTGAATRAAVIRGLAGGADGYITKPFDPDTLLQAVRTVLGGAAPGAPLASHPAWVNRDALQRRIC